MEITDTSDPRGGQPGNIGIDLTRPDTWNGNNMAEGGGVYCGPASFVTLSGDQGLAAGYAIASRTSRNPASCSTPRSRPAIRTCRRSRRPAGS
jgi:hypothetical protein